MLLLGSRRKARVRSRPGRILWILPPLLASLLLVEVSLQGLVSVVFKQGRLFESDPILGWRPIPSLSLIRRNADGDLWAIETNDMGYRGTRSWTRSGRRRLLVLGDSFAFGEGVSVESRFDTVLASSDDVWDIVNKGVMGYWTDQEVLSGLPYYKRLNTADGLLLLFCGNDVFDVLRRSFAGRPKPWLELSENQVAWHEPRLSALAALRNRSYLASWVLAKTEAPRSSYSSEDTKQGLRTVEALLIRYLSPLASRGIHVLVARHQDRTISAFGGLTQHSLDAWWNAACLKAGIACVTLDPYLEGRAVLLRDGHWNSLGHRIAARVIGDALRGVD